MIGERTSEDYILLHLSDTLAEARERLVVEEPGFHAVILDDEERPVTVITADDILHIDGPDDRQLADIAGQLPPGVITQATALMEVFANSSEFIALSAGARGAIVFDERLLVGVLTYDAITNYLRDEFELLGELMSLPSDARLPGSIGEHPIIMYCDEYNHRNELIYYNRRKPPECQDKTPQPHPVRK